MEKLWAPWRMEYIHSPKNGSDECIFCRKSHSDNIVDDLILHQGKHSFILLNLYPYTNGHIMVAPYSHKSHFEDLESDVKLEMMNLVSDCMTIMRQELKAEGFNFGANFGSAAGAGIEEHLHLHIVPRWSGDTNFMPVLGHTKVMMDGLKECRQTLADALDAYHISQDRN